VNRRFIYGAFLVALLGLVALVAVRGGAPEAPPEGSHAAGRPPRIRPDYADCTVPPNIAPLNFRILESGQRYYVAIAGAAGEAIELACADPDVVIPPRRWRALLLANRASRITVQVWARGADGSWVRFEPFSLGVAPDEVDGYLVYRLIDPVCNIWSKMGLYERELATYREREILNDRSVHEACINCHAFPAHGTDKMLFHFRRGHVDHGLGMLLFDGKRIGKVDVRTASNPYPAAYASWHPSGKLIAFSVNKVRQFFHHARGEIRDVVDLESDLAVYDIPSNAVSSAPQISDPDILETYPCWSPDGRYLYFSRAPILWKDRNDVPPEHFRELRYSLARVSYDIATGQWGEVETVLSSDQTGRSIVEPRVSPDGRYVLLCMCDYGPFPVVQPSADLYVLDLQTGRWAPFPYNSEVSDSWHCWSSNGRWICYASKKDDDLRGRVYFSYFDAEGRAHKPFVLPQRDPQFYDSFLLTYNVPELVRRPVRVRGERLARVIRSSRWMRSSTAVTGATPSAGGGGPSAEPWSQRER